MSDFTHLDPLGRARMVDVTPKEPTHRRAVARCKVSMKPETTAAIANREVNKGDVLSVARIAAIQAAKRTADTIPLCHPVLVGAVSVNFEIGDDFVAVEANVDTVDRTGVEMEALHACAVAALTIYDMCKSADRGMVIGELALWEKTGGRSGIYRRSDARRGGRRVRRQTGGLLPLRVESSYNRNVHGDSGDLSDPQQCTVLPAERRSGAYMTGRH